MAPMANKNHKRMFLLVLRKPMEKTELRDFQADKVDTQTFHFYLTDSLNYSCSLSHDAIWFIWNKSMILTLDNGFSFVNQLSVLYSYSYNTYSTLRHRLKSINWWLCIITLLHICLSVIHYSWFRGGYRRNYLLEIFI